MPDIAFRTYLPYHKSVVVAPVVVTADTPTFTVLNTLEVTANLLAGEYVITAGWEWFMLDQNDSALFRLVSPLTLGTVYSLEPKDNSDLVFQTASAPVTHAGGQITFVLECSKTSNAQDLTINWSSIEFERQA